MYTGLSFVFFMAILFIIMDRFLSVLLNVKYGIYCTKKRIKRLLITTWVIGSVIAVSISVAQYTCNYEWEHKLYIYFYPIMEFSIIAVTFATYSFIFSRYKKSLQQHRTTRCGEFNTTSSSSFTLFRKSKFYIPVLLVGTFIVFMVLPDMVMLYYGVLGNNMSETLSAFCMLSYSLSNLADGWIYIFMQPPVVLFLKRRLMRCINFLGVQRKCRGSLNIYVTSHRHCGSNESAAEISNTNSNLRQTCPDSSTL